MNRRLDLKNRSDLRIRKNRIRRRRELRNHLLLFVCTICFISIFAVTFGSFLSKAKDANSEIPVYKYFTSVMVSPGDSLYSIASVNAGDAQSLDSYVNEVIHINALEDDTIHAGQYIIVPYYSTEFK